jgi:hypothetical protein
MHPSDGQDAKKPKERTHGKDVPVVVPFKPRPVQPPPSRDPDDPGPDTAA